MASPEQMRMMELDKLMRAGDTDRMAAMLRDNPEMIRMISGRDLQRFLVERPEMQDFLAEISTINRAGGTTRESSRARNVDLAARLGIAPALSSRFLRRGDAQATMEGARARTAAASEFQQRKNDPLRNAPVQSVLDAAQQGFTRQATTGGNIASGVGLGLGVAGTVASLLAAPVTMGASLIPAAIAAPLTAGLTTAGALTKGFGELGKTAGLADRQRQLAAIGDEARIAAQGAPDYTDIYRSVPGMSAPQTTQLALTEAPREDERYTGFLWG